MTSLVKVSPSQVKRWRDCKRWWAFEKIEGQRSDAGPKAAFGTECHGHLEQWVLNGAPFPDTASGRNAQRLAPWTAAPRDPRVVVEGTDEHGARKMFEIHDAVMGVVLNGYIDLEAPPGVLHAVAPTIVDYKFTGSLRWAMTSAELKQDPQGLMYFLHASNKYGVDEVSGQWLYGEFSPSTWEPKGRKKVEAMFSRSDPQVIADLGEVLADAAAIRDARLNAKEAHDLPPNPGACGKFGGCPFSDRCHRSVAQKLGALFAGAERMKDSKHETLTLLAEPANNLIPKPHKPEAPMVSMLEKLKARTEAAATAAPAAAPAASPLLSLIHI